MDRDTARDIVKGYLESYLQSTGRSTRKPFSCINPEHNDTHPSMSYDRRGNHCKCFSCGAYYDIFDVVAIDYGLTSDVDIFNKAYELYGVELEKRAPEEARKDFKEVSTAPTTEVQKQDKNEQKTAGLMEYYKKCQQKLTETAYLTKRGISPEVAKKYLVGYEEHFTAYEKDENGNSIKKEWKALIIPTGYETYTARNTDTTADKKNRVRKHGSSVLFNSKAFKTADKPIFIVEGELDALSIIEVGGVAVGLGSTANTRQLVALLEKERPGQPLVIALDNDEEGQKATEELIQELNRIELPFYRLNIYGEAKDANEALLADREAFTQAVASPEDLQKQALEQEKEEYLKTSTASHLQDFINGIAESVNTPALPTGFTKLDKILEGGLYEGLYFCGAISSLGKTTLITQIADQLAQAGTDVLIFSLEMARSELIAKSISRHTLLDTIENAGSVNNAKTARGITAGNRYANYSTTEKELIERAITAYGSYAEHIYIHEGVGNLGVKEVKEVIDKHILFTGRKPVVIIDYVQILAPYDMRATDKQNIDKAVLELKRVSRDYKIPVIGISSVNRANYSTPISMEAFKESGAIEFGSDVLLGLQLKGVGSKDFDVNKAKAKNPREVELVVLKNRNGATGATVPFEYYPMFNYFKEL